MKRERGFTLVDLMATLSIIAVLVAMVVPALQQARITANEASAINTLRTLTTVNQQYRTRFGKWTSGLAPLFSAGYIDEVIATGSKSGYVITYSVIGTNDYSIRAEPATPATTGNRYFMVDQTGVIRFSTSATATATSTPVE